MSGSNFAATFFCNTPRAHRHHLGCPSHEKAKCGFSSSTGLSPLPTTRTAPLVSTRVLPDARALFPAYLRVTWVRWAFIGPTMTSKGTRELAHFRDHFLQSLLPPILGRRARCFSAALGCPVCIRLRSGDRRKRVRGVGDRVHGVVTDPFTSAQMPCCVNAKLLADKPNSGGALSKVRSTKQTLRVSRVEEQRPRRRLRLFRRLCLVRRRGIRTN